MAKGVLHTGSSTSNLDNNYVKKTGDTITGQLYVNYEQSVGLDQSGSLIIGDKTGQNIGINGNHIMARDNSAASTLYFNYNGGEIHIGKGGVYTAGRTYCYSPDQCLTHINGKSITFGVGSGKNNRGIWNNDAGSWMIYTKDDNNYCYTNRLYGAVWNDYAEYRMTKKEIQPGRVIIETGEGDLVLSTKRLQAGANVVSDTYGFAIGETEESKTPIAVSGRALVYPYEDRETYKPGEAVCSGPDGTVSRMTRKEIIKYPERIVGTVSEIPNYKTWGTNNVEVDGRIWIKVK